MARPTKLTARLTVVICKAIERGCGSLEAAAAASGISRSTLFEWRTRGRAGEEPFASFFERTETAREAGKAKALAAISRNRSWQSKAWLLERSFPMEYSLQAPRLHAQMAADLDAALDRVDVLLETGRLSREQHADVLAALSNRFDLVAERQPAPEFSDPLKRAPVEPSSATGDGEAQAP